MSLVERSQHNSTTNDIKLNGWMDNKYAALSSYLKL